MSNDVSRGCFTRYDRASRSYVFAEGPCAGEPTKSDAAGFCDRCQSFVHPREPDPCLGYLPGVAFACCGHGKGEAYVVVGGAPNEGACDPRPNLRRDDALAFFALFGRGPARLR